MLSYSVNFRSNYFVILAARYTGAVRREAQRHGLSSSLIYAVVENESAFNPLARSPAPAYGLMQIVPGTAGRDAYAFVHGAVGEPEPETLYDPQTNITLGAAYLKLVNSHYLKALTDENSRTYATIAAYNTGTGNVARAFGSATNIASAAGVINSLPSDEVLRRLQVQLPRQETRRYVAAVLASRGRYSSFDGAGPSERS